MRELRSASYGHIAGEWEEKRMLVNTKMSVAIYSYSHSFSKDFPGASSVTGTVVGTVDTALSRTDKNPFSHDAHALFSETMNRNNSTK